MLYLDAIFQKDIYPTPELPNEIQAVFFFKLSVHTRQKEPVNGMTEIAKEADTKKCYLQKKHYKKFVPEKTTMFKICSGQSKQVPSITPKD